MAITFIRPEDLPAASSVSGASAIPVDDGSTVEKATPAQIVAAGRPIASEAQALAGVNNNTAMTPLTTKQAMDSNNTSLQGDIDGLASTFAVYAKNPTVTSDDDAYTATFDGDVLTGDHGISVPDGSGTLALVSQIAGIVSGQIASLPRTEVGTFTPAFKFTAPGDTTFTYEDDNSDPFEPVGNYAVIGPFVVWSVYIRATRVPGASPAGAGQSLLLDLSDLGDTGGGPYLPASRLNGGQVTFKGGGINRNNLRLSTVASSSDVRIYYDDVATAGTQQLTYADMDNAVGSIFSAWGWLVK